MFSQPTTYGSYVTLTLLLCWSHLVDSITCPPFNPPLPISAPLVGTAAISRAVQALTTSVEMALADGAVLDNTTTSFSSDFYSLDENRPLFNYHFSAPGLSNASEGVTEVDSETVYRVGSVSKVFTVYAFLANVGDVSWNQPITKYVPELARVASSTADDSDLDVVRWEDVTIGSLASQLGGIARDPAPNAQVDMALRLAAGFPAVPPVNGTYCNGSALVQLPCDREAFFTNLLGQHPVVPPHHTPVYTNLAYQILAYALENMTDTRFPELLNSTILFPLSLTSTYYPLAPSSATANAIIPFNDTSAWYSTNLRPLNPGGAVYSTTNDMRSFGKSILNSTLLSSALTRRWLKPHSFTPDSYLSVGAPWEIMTYPPTSRFPVQIYSKAGDVGLYSTVMGLVPDYNVGFTVLAAGTAHTRTSRFLSDLLVSSFVPAIKQVAASQANETYAGIYSSSDGSNSTMSFSVTPNEGDVGSNLRLDSLVYNGTDLVSFVSLALGIDETTTELTIDMYPTGLTQRQRNGREVIESWRASFNVQPVASNRTLEAGTSQLGPFSTACGAWESVDGLVYGGVAIDEILFRRDEGDVTGVEVRFLQQGFWGKKAEESGNVRREEGVLKEGVRMKMKKVMW